MNSYIAHRVEHTTDRAFFTLKEDLIVIAKQKAFELNANAIITTDGPIRVCVPVEIHPLQIDFD